MPFPAAVRRDAHVVRRRGSTGVDRCGHTESRVGKPRDADLGGQWGCVGRVRAGRVGRGRVRRRIRGRGIRHRPIAPRRGRIGLRSCVRARRQRRLAVVPTAPHQRGAPRRHEDQGRERRPSIQSHAKAPRATRRANDPSRPRRVRKKGEHDSARDVDRKTRPLTPLARVPPPRRAWCAHARELAPGAKGGSDSWLRGATSSFSRTRSRCRSAAPRAACRRPRPARRSLLTDSRRCCRRRGSGPARTRYPRGHRQRRRSVRQCERLRRTPTWQRAKTMSQAAETKSQTATTTSQTADTMLADREGDAADGEDDRRRRRSKEEVANGRARDGAPATSTTDQAHIAAAFCDFVSTCCSDEQTRCVRSPRQAATVTRGRSRGMRGERGEYERDAARPRALRSRRHAVGSVRPSHDAAGSGSDRDHAPLRSRDDRARRRASQPRLRRVPRRAEPLPPRRPRGRSPRFRPSPLVGEGARVPRS